jgi:hypothetical protein
MSTGHPAMHEVQYLGIGVALVRYCQELLMAI